MKRKAKSVKWYFWGEQIWLGGTFGNDFEFMVIDGRYKVVNTGGIPIKGVGSK